MQIKAAVVRERSGPFVIDTLDLDPRPEELIVRVVATGMCQTDLHGRDGYFASPYPGVYGHEGAGVVHAVGAPQCTTSSRATTLSCHFPGAAPARTAGKTGFLTAYTHAA